MAKKYHLGDDGQPRPCDANIKCPKGGDAPHFTGDIKDARAWAEEQNAQAAGGSFGAKNNSERTVADDALEVSERKLEIEKRDLAENIEAVKAKEELLNEAEAEVDRLQAQGADEQEIMEAEDEAYIANADLAYYKENIDENKSAIEEIEGDINFANMVKRYAAAVSVNNDIEETFRKSELGTGVSVGSDGSVTTDGADTPSDDFIYADSSGNLVDYDEDWEPVGGMSGQHGYDGPIMHPSESIGGGMIDIIRENPGTYVALPVEQIDEDDDDYGDNLVGWAILRKNDTEPDYDSVYEVDDRVKNMASIQRSKIDSFPDDHDFDDDVSLFATDAAAETEDFAFESDDYDDVVYTAHDTYDAQKQEGFSKKESMKSAVTAAVQKAHDINEGYADYYKENPEVSDGVPDKETDYYQGHSSDDLWKVSAEALDNDEKTYTESLKIAQDKNATGEDIRKLVERRRKQDLRLANNLDGVNFDNVDWDEKLNDIRESHDL